LNVLFDLPRPFFPNAVFAWVWLALLMTAVGVAAYTDTRRAKVPNLLVVVTLAAGLLTNVVRGAWQVAAEHPTGLFGKTDNLWLGGLDGLLFGLIGFAVGFGVFFGVWALSGGKMIGGGDVKLFAALGGWLGLPHLVLVWLLSVGVLILWTLGKVIGGGLRPGKLRSSMKRVNDASKRGAPDGPKGKLRITYSLPIAVAVLLLSVWSHRVELLLARPKPVPPPETPGANAHDPPSPEPPPR
jgi:prepilin peptidase CpaA